MLARGEAFRRWLSDLGREDLLPEASAHGRLGYRRSLTLPGLPFPVQVIRPAGEREASEQQANPGMECFNTGRRLPTPHRPADQGHWTRTGGLASGLKDCHLCVPHSHPNTGQGEPKRPLPVPAAVAPSPPGLSDPVISVAKPR